QPALNRPHDIWPTDDWFAEQPVPFIEDLTKPPPRFRLGIHFEKLFQKWLTVHPLYNTAAKNLQVHSAGRTLGEFDLLVEGPDGVEHWELAIKFYINQQSHHDPRSWFGPDPTDTLATKLDRLNTHQLCLSEQPPAQALLSEMGITLAGRRSIMKGRLYHPWAQFQASHFAVPEIVNPHHLKGWWLKQQDIDQLRGARLIYLDKSLWLSDVCPDDVDQVMDLRGLTDIIEETDQIATQVALLDANNRETSRGFILKPEWFRQAIHTS
ncbi:MAG: hypothetical protein ACI9W1_003050, partial [Candidatus Azotimanducaceae bacterium]